VAQAQNPKLVAWLKDPPYAWIDPCPQMFEFNTLAKPWDDPDMRWAVSYGIDKVTLANVTNEGAGLVAKWLFPDYAGLTELLNADQDVFDKYPTDKFDQAKAASIIEGKGYKKGADGIYVKDGKRLKLHLLMQSPSEGVGWGIATSQIIQDLNAIGIEVSPTLLSKNAYDAAAQLGQFEGRMYTICGSVADPYLTLSVFTADKADLPLVVNQPSGRWKNSEYSALVDQIGRLVPGDPKIATLTHDALAIFQRELPGFPLYQHVRLVPYNTTYWTNWPTKENNYFQPPNWWMSFLRVVTELKPAQ